LWAVAQEHDGVQKMAKAVGGKFKILPTRAAIRMNNQQPLYALKMAYYWLKLFMSVVNTIDKEWYCISENAI
jgi:hypothetical protein